MKINLNTITFVFLISLFSGVNTHASEQSLATQNTSEACGKWDPNDARLPTGNCPKPKKTIKYDPDCARLYGCSDNSGNKAPSGLSANERDGGTKATLLLPAVQSAH